MSKKVIVAAIASLGVVALLILAAALIAQAVSRAELAATACSRQDQEAYISLLDSATSNEDYVTQLGVIANSVEQNTGYASEPSCGVIVFKHKITQDDVDGAQEVLKAVKAGVRQDSTYVADELLIRQMEAEIAFPAQSDNQLPLNVAGG